MSVKRVVTKLIKKHDTSCPLTLAKRLNVEVEFVNLGKKFLGFYSKKGRVPVITINNNVSEKQQLFICAHELGHHVLQPGLNTPFLAKNTFFSTDIYEIEAHTFAIELLFYNHHCITKEDLDSFGIPHELMKYKN